LYFFPLPQTGCCDPLSSLLSGWSPFRFRLSCLGTVLARKVCFRSIRISFHLFFKDLNGGRASQPCLFNPVQHVKEQLIAFYSMRSFWAQPQSDPFFQLIDRKEMVLPVMIDRRA
jgi:hypothetical protein